MKHFAVFLTMKDEEKSKNFRNDHLEFIEKMKKEKHIALFGRFVDGAGGLIIYRGRTLEEVERFVQQDPYVHLGARGYEIHEWDMHSAD